MSWKDYAVFSTHTPATHTPPAPEGFWGIREVLGENARGAVERANPAEIQVDPDTEGGFGGSGGSGLNKTKRAFSSSIDSSSQISTSSKHPPIRTKPPEGPTPPLRPGWLIAYRDPSGALRGGADEREAGTVQACEFQGSSWTVRLTNGDELPLCRITAVAKTDEGGRILAAWATRSHGYDGLAGRYPSMEAVKGQDEIKMRNSLSIKASL